MHRQGADAIGDSDGYWLTMLVRANGSLLTYSSVGLISPSWQLTHEATMATGVDAAMNRTLPSHMAA
jgi:hypothetical protein